MNNFTENRLKDESIGSQLKEERTKKGINLEEAALKLNINIKYLKNIENNEFHKLPEGIYKTNYIKEYAILLGLDRQKLLKNDGNLFLKKDEDPFSQKTPKRSSFLNIPYVIKSFFIVLIIFLLIFYLGLYIKNLISPPGLLILSPEDNLITNENIITISGITDSETEIKINDNTVLTDTEGKFEKEINLKKGINIIKVTAQKKYSKKTTEERKILAK